MIDIFKSKILFSDSFIKISSFNDVFLKSKWYGIENIYIDKVTMDFLKRSNLLYCNYDENVNNISYISFLNDYDHFFFNSSIVFSSDGFCMYNWYSEYLIINDKIEIFEDAFNKTIREISLSEGGYFNSPEFHEKFRKSVPLSNQILIS